MIQKLLPLNFHTVNKGDCANREKWINSCPSHLSSLMEREDDNCTHWVWFHCPVIDFTLIPQDTFLSTTVHGSLHFHQCRNKHDVVNFKYNLSSTIILLFVQKEDIRLQRGKKYAVHKLYSTAANLCQALCKMLYFQNSKHRILSLEY